MSPEAAVAILVWNLLLSVGIVGALVALGGEHRPEAKHLRIHGATLDCQEQQMKWNMAQQIVNAQIQGVLETLVKEPDDPRDTEAAR